MGIESMFHCTCDRKGCETEGMEVQSLGKVPPGWCEFEVRKEDGEPSYQDKESVYRGVWCPDCMTIFNDLAGVDVLPRLHLKGKD